MTLRERLLVITLAVFLSVTAVAIINSKHTSRMLFKQGRELQALIDDARINWGRLQIEESTLARYGRIEEIARTELNMISPLHKNVKTVLK